MLLRINPAIPLARSPSKIQLSSKYSVEENLPWQHTFLCIDAAITQDALTIQSKIQHSKCSPTARAKPLVFQAGILILDRDATTCIRYEPVPLLLWHVWYRCNSSTICACIDSRFIQVKCTFSHWPSVPLTKPRHIQYIRHREGKKRKYLGNILIMSFHAMNWNEGIAAIKVLCLCGYSSVSLIWRQPFIRVRSLFGKKLTLKAITKLSAIHVLNIPQIIRETFSLVQAKWVYSYSDQIPVVLIQRENSTMFEWCSTNARGQSAKYLNNSLVQSEYHEDDQMRHKISSLDAIFRKK